MVNHNTIVYQYRSGNVHNVIVLYQHTITRLHLQLYSVDQSEPVAPVRIPKGWSPLEKATERRKDAAAAYITSVMKDVAAAYTTSVIGDGAPHDNNEEGEKVKQEGGPAVAVREDAAAAGGVDCVGGGGDSGDDEYDPDELD